MKRLIMKYRYECIAAVAGAVVMILELVGARMIAPFFGTSIYVWTAMIGVILGALSFGYWYGGRIADRGANDVTLMKIIVLSAVTILVMLSLQEALLERVAAVIVDVRLGSLLAALILFAPAAVLLGIVSPYVARLRVDSLASAGRSIGRLYAAGTLGSIIGTFLAGYWLIALFGNRQLGYGLVLVLVLLSLLVSYRGWWVARALTALLAIIGTMSLAPLGPNVVADIDSAYSRYFVTETDDIVPLRLLSTDPFGTQSAQYVGQPDVLPLEYTQRFMTALESLQPDRALVIGGGVYTFPYAAARAHPEIDITVVEIDPELTEIAHDYFGIKDRANLSIVHQDGRVFLNRADQNSFQMIFMDAFSSLTPPYQLTTSESVRATKRLLAKDGALVTNVIAHATGDPYVSALLATQAQHFSDVAVYQVSPGRNPHELQNLLMVATMSPVTGSKLREALNASPLLIPKTAPLTDNYAPVEQLINSR